MNNILGIEIKLTTLAGAIVGIIAVLIILGLTLNWLDKTFDLNLGLGNILLFTAAIIIIIVLALFIYRVLNDRY